MRILGNLQAESITISGKLDCANDVTCTILDVGKDCSISGNLSAKKVNIRGTLMCDELGSEDIIIKEQAIIRGTADISGDVYVERSLICLDGVTADGEVSTGYIVAGEYAELDGRAIILSELEDGGQECKKRPTPIEIKPIAIADEDLSTIKDFDSPLASVLDDVAMFIENCQNTFPKESVASELDAIKSLAGFLPSFDALYIKLSSALNIAKEATIEDWYKDFISLTDAFISLPKWMYSSKCSDELYDNILRFLKAYETNNFGLRSRYMWVRSLNAISLLKADDRLTKEVGNHVDLCLSIMFGKIGIKSKVVKMYLPEA